MDKELESALNQVSFNNFKQFCKRYNTLSMTVATAVSDALPNATTKVYFPNDTSTQSQLYVNRTGLSISSGDKVYIIHPTFNISQGWIGVLPN